MTGYLLICKVNYVASNFEPNVCYLPVITFESVILSTPFENNVEVFELRGDHIMEMLEFSVANDPYAGARMLQVSGNDIFPKVNQI